ncbi:MAG: SDR family oxidoreductase [Anaerolineae bacterium]|jgi:NAD(P)-dependent dehydrogenase (short-subunit alcohol dehydrogenase family)|nr:SDR family oxidoreductase [Anaerolineae bacterium]
MSDMQGRVCIVTGATNGLGEVNALELARMGGTVVIIGRNEDKAKATLQKINSAVVNADVHYLIADLSLMRDVKRVADDFRAKFDRLDVLVNNAGMIFDKRIVTAEGLEMTFALNHMSYFYLTHLLMDMLKASGTPTKKSRIVNVASNLHRIGAFDFDDMQNEKRFISAPVYGQTKCMNVVHAYELHRRLSAQHANVTANALHPGGVRTGFASNTGGATRVITKLLRFLSFSPEQGARTQIYLASSPDVEGVSGQYFSMSKPKPSSKFSQDESNGKRLWAYSEEILHKLGL